MYKYIYVCEKPADFGRWVLLYVYILSSYNFLRIWKCQPAFQTTRGYWNIISCIQSHLYRCICSSIPRIFSQVGYKHFNRHIQYTAHIFTLLLCTQYCIVYTIWYPGGWGIWPSPLDKPLGVPIHIALQQRCHMYMRDVDVYKVARKNTKRTEEYNTYSNIIYIYIYIYIVHSADCRSTRCCINKAILYIMSCKHIVNVFAVYIRARTPWRQFLFLFFPAIHFALGQTKLWGIRIHPYKLFVKMFCTPNMTEYTLFPQISKTFSRVRSKTI